MQVGPAIDIDGVCERGRTGHRAGSPCEGLRTSGAEQCATGTALRALAEDSADASTLMTGWLLLDRPTARTITWYPYASAGMWTPDARSQQYLLMHAGALQSGPLSALTIGGIASSLPHPAMPEDSPLLALVR